jgi:surface polysaccharide O-acyltransferase-like enzyme
MQFTASAKARRFDLDWVRVITMLLLLLFHSGRLFNYTPWHLKNAETTVGIEIYIHFFDYWGMPMFFLVAGAAVWFSLGVRKTGQFVRERFLRILVPLVFGMLIIVPPQVYLERIYEGDFSGSFFQFYPHVFTHGTYSYEGLGNLSWHHLWFLAYLFFICLIALPLLLWLRREAGSRFLDSLASFTCKGVNIFLYMLPLCLWVIALGPLSSGENDLIHDWAHVMYYLSFFIYGYLLYSREGFWQAVDRYKTLALILAVPLSLLEMALDGLGFKSGGPYSLVMILFSCAWCFIAWCWIVAFLGYAHKFLSFTNRFLSYANAAVLPFYILHQLMIIVVGYFVIQWQMNVYLKFIIVVVASFVGIMLLYEFIKRTVVTRFIFGMRLKKK